jgi:ATP-binding cassette subfamily B protein
MADALDVLELPVESDRLQRSIAPLRFDTGIAFQGVSFRYWPDGPDVLNDVQITIERGARVGIVGASGSGKSTLLDLIMGLLEPTRGKIVVDGEPLEGARRRAWQLALAHVPQDIFLADTSLAANIAFGVRPELLDMKKVEDAARRANLAEYIASCPQGYDTRVGERGVRLSGGQRQRVGIARAFYKGAQVLILDEATNALDDVTEQGILETLAAIDRDITILVVAHRASTLRYCDYVIEVCDGIVRKK